MRHVTRTCDTECAYHHCSCSPHLHPHLPDLIFLTLATRCRQRPSRTWTARRGVRGGAWKEEAEAEAPRSRSRLCACPGFPSRGRPWAAGNTPVTVPESTSLLTSVGGELVQRGWTCRVTGTGQGVQRCSPQYCFRLRSEKTRVKSGSQCQNQCGRPGPAVMIPQTPASLFIQNEERKSVFETSTVKCWFPLFLFSLAFLPRSPRAELPASGVFHPDPSNKPLPALLLQVHTVSLPWPVKLLMPFSQ